MATVTQIRKFRRIIIYTASILLALFFIFLVFVDRFVEPILRDRIHTLIVQGSDSLYTYTLGKVKANFFGGNVEIRDLQISIDSNRYEVLRKRNALPALTMQLKLDRGHIKGISVVSLLLGKKIRIEEIMSKQADIKLSRHPRVNGDKPETDAPLWKSIQPDIEAIYVKRIKLDGVKFLYRNADTSESVKLQFDRCDALFEDISIDSVSSVDTARIGFTKNIFMKFHDLKYRTEDSAYKMKAEWITYSSKDRTFEVDSFKLQPTLEREDIYKASSIQKSIYYIEFVKVRFRNIKLDRFIHNNRIEADSIFFETPDITIYNDRSVLPDFESKVGKYPHQRLLQSSAAINVRNLGFANAKINYIEKAAKSMQEGTVSFSDLSMRASNITNDGKLIKQNPVCTASIEGKLLGSSPFNIDFRFMLDSTNGYYEAKGSVKNINAQQLNPLAIPLANVTINSFNIHNLDFAVTARDFDAFSNVKMRYNNLALTIKKADEETGVIETKKFITKILNRFIIWSDNPGPDGIERIAQNAKVLRLTTQSFFGLFWKSVFSGMQDIMMRAGRYE